MVRAELVSKLANGLDITRKQADIAVKTIFDSIVGSLQNGEKVELRGFGSFTVRERVTRIARNPKTGEIVNVPAKKVPFFRAGKDLKIVG